MTARKSTRQMATEAFARNGLNTLLLDIKEDVGFLSAKVENINETLKEAGESRKAVQGELSKLNNTVNRLCETVEQIDPIVKDLNLAHQQRIGLGRVIKRSHAVYTAIGVSGLAVLHWFTGWPKPP